MSLIGKLPITIPRSSGHLPDFYNHKPSARRGYLFEEVKPLYPFGHGLSYTDFKMTDIKLNKNKISKYVFGSTLTLFDSI